MNVAVQPAQTVTRSADDSSDDAVGLPAWIYSDPDFFELEKRAIFRTSWQLVCHVNDMPKPGDYHSFDLLGEAVVVVRGDDGQIRSFHNVCRHRASRLLDGPKGTAAGASPALITRGPMRSKGGSSACPIATRSAISTRRSTAWSPLEQEIFMGFIFVRFEPGLPSVREMAAPYIDELAAYRMEELVPQGRVTLRPRHGQLEERRRQLFRRHAHPVAHPGLTRLFGRSYGIEAQEWIDKMWGYLRDAPSSNWSERRISKLLPTGRAPAAGAAAAVDLLQALAERRLRHLSGPDRFHAVPAGVADRDA